MKLTCPQLYTVAMMSQALKHCRRLDDASARAACYVAAGIEDVDVLRFDQHALIGETARRKIYGGPDYETAAEIHLCE